MTKNEVQKSGQEVAQALDTSEFQVAPHYAARVEAQDAFESRLRNGEVNWGYTEGDYTDVHFFTVDVPNPVVTFVDGQGVQRKLQGVEVLLASQIRAQIAQKPPDRPIIALDLGGGIGNSWSRLARYFEADVAAGNVAFVVTNGTNQPEEYAKYKTEAAAPDLVHTVTSLFSDLGEQATTLPDGRVIPLAGNTDIMHEDYSLTHWTQVPERDIPRAAGLLSQQAIYLLSDEQLIHLSRSSSAAENSARLEGIQIAHRALQNRHGLRVVNTIEQGEYGGQGINYRIFKAPNAPAVDLSLGHRDVFRAADAAAGLGPPEPPLAARRTQMSATPPRRRQNRAK